MVLCQKNTFNGPTTTLSRYKKLLHPMWPTDRLVKMVADLASFKELILDLCSYPLALSSQLLTGTLRENIITLFSAQEATLILRRHKNLTLAVMLLVPLLSTSSVSLQRKIHAMRFVALISCRFTQWTLMALYQACLLINSSKSNKMDLSWLPKPPRNFDFLNALSLNQFISNFYFPLIN